MKIHWNIPDRELALEAGYASALGKPVVVLWAGEPQPASIYGYLVPTAQTMNEAVEMIQEMLGRESKFNKDLFQAGRVDL